MDYDVKTYLIVGIGGAIGSIARYWLGHLGDTLLVGAFPWSILIINVLGCFVIGLFNEATSGSGMLEVSSEFKVFVIVGLCGGFTTFSAFSLGTIALLLHGELVGAIGNVLLSLISCLLAVVAGIWLVRFTNLSTDKMEDGRV